MAAALLLAGAGGTLASADTGGESAGGESASSSGAAESGPAPAAHSVDAGAASGTEHPTATVGAQADSAVERPHGADVQTIGRNLAWSDANL
jgi:hypothetical protein